MRKSFTDSPYNANGYEQVLVDSSGGNVTVNLPAASGNKPVGVFKITADTNLITVVPAGSPVQTINGLADISILRKGDSLETYPDSVTGDWWL